MSRWLKILINVLFLFIFVTFMVHFFPGISMKISKVVSLTDNQISNFLTLVDICLSTIVALYSLLEQKLAEQRCSYVFSIENDNLSLESYRRFPSEKRNFYSYDYKRRSNDIESPYYGMEVKLEKDALCSVGIPLLMEVHTGLNGEKIVFSNLKVYIRYEDNVICKKLSHGIIIENPIHDGKKFLIRIQLLCNHNLEKKLLDSQIHLCFTVALKTDRGRKYKKYVYLNIRNTIGETRILSMALKNSWHLYIGKLIELHYQLYHKIK